METIATALVFDRGMHQLQFVTDKLNKRAKRHGMEPLVVRVESVLGFVPIRSNSFGCTENLYRVSIEGVAPRINGWRLAARVEFNGVVGNVVRLAPGVDDDGSFSVYRTIEPICEHCNSRRRRNDVFVLEHEDGCRKVVGRNCLADFLRCESAADFARMAEFADEMVSACSAAERDDADYFDGMGCGRAPSVVPIDRYLTVVSMLIRKVGWTSRTAAREACDFSGLVATADLAVRVLYPVTRYDREWIEREELYVSDYDMGQAALAAKWARDDNDGGSEYLHIIKRIATEGLVDVDNLGGYAASIIVAYRKACEREAERAERAKVAKIAVWYGEAKKRYRAVKVVCKGTHSFEGMYGVTTIVRFEHSVSDTEKAVLVWFASGSKEDEWEAGKDYVVDFTVKDYDDHERYGKQTKINRVKKV